MARDRVVGLAEQNAKCRPFEWFNDGNFGKEHVQMFRFLFFFLLLRVRCLLRQLLM